MIEKKTTISGITTMLFDLDGTLLDSRDCLINAALKTVKKYCESDCKYEEVLQRFGSDFSNYLSSIHPDSDEVKHYFASEKWKYYDTNSLFPYVREGLTKLVEQGIRIGIVTNQQKDLVIKVLDKNELLNLFEVIVTKNDVINPKPSPEPIHLAMKKLGVDPSSVWMVGDTNYDLLSAERAGVDCVLFKFYEEDHCTRHSAPVNIFTNFHDFVNFVTKHDEEGVLNG